MLRMTDVTREMNDSYKSHRINRRTFVSILSKREKKGETAHALW